MKFFLVFILTFCFAPFCFSQDDDEFENDNPIVVKRKGVPKPQPRPLGSPLSIKFQANHHFYLKVDNKERGKVEKDDFKTIFLNPGIHKLVFEEADSTGERMEKYIRVIAGMKKQKDTVISVVFKKDLPDIIRTYPGNKP